MEFFFALSAVLVSSVGELNDDTAYERTEICMPVGACLQVLRDGLAEEDYPRIYPSRNADIARRLQARFGDEAKAALLALAADDDLTSRRLATTLLMEWPDWSADDLPVLNSIIEQSPDSPLVRIIGDIGTDEAIEMLVENLGVMGDRNATSGLVLIDLGPRVLPFLTPLLMEEPTTEEDMRAGKPYKDGYRSAVYIIEEMGARAAGAGAFWIDIANNRREPVHRRMAALRGIAALGGYGEDYVRDVRRLARVRDKSLAAQVFETRAGLHDPEIAADFAATCQPTDKKWDTYSRESYECLNRLAAFGHKGTKGGEPIYVFLESENRAERLYAIETLGLIGDRDAIPLIENFLESDDWEEVFLAVKALGQLGAKKSLSRIEEVTMGHWFRELELFGKKTSALVGNDQLYSGYDDEAGRYYLVVRGIESGTNFARENRHKNCASSRYEFDGTKIDAGTGQAGAEELVFPDGKLVARDHGEFGGDYSWVPVNGEPVILIPDNTERLWRVGNGIIATHGLGHMSISYGYATYAEWNEEGIWQIEEIARFPGATRQVRRLDDTRFIAEWGGRAILFTQEGIKTTGDCID